MVGFVSKSEMTLVGRSMRRRPSRPASDKSCYRKPAIVPEAAAATTTKAPTSGPQILATKKTTPAQAILDAVISRGDSPHTRRAYATDLTTFSGWLSSEGLSWDDVTSGDLDRYREWLSCRYARTTSNRRLVVVRALYGEAHRRHLISEDPASCLRGVRGRDDRDGGAMTRGQARDVIDAMEADLLKPDRSLTARRDMAIVSILLRTGLRRSELTSLRVSSLGTAQ